MKNKVKVLRILNRFNVGGPIYNATYLTKYLNPDKYETLLIGGINENHEQPGDYILKNEGISYTKLKYMKRNISIFYDLIALIQILKIIYTYKPDIIHTHAAKAGLLGRISSILYLKKVKIVHTYHGNVFDGYFSPFKTKIILIIERFLAKKTTKIVSISNLQKSDLVNKYYISTSDKISVIPLGFDLTKFSKNITEKRLKTRKEFKIDGSTILISIIGRVVPIKNHKLFIDVFKYVKEKTDLKVKAIVVGDGSELNNIIIYASQRKIKSSYKEIKDSDDINFASWRSDIDNILAASDVVCLTSINEGTPVSIIESMASGTASISTNVGGVSDIISDSIDGLIADNDFAKYGEKLLKLIENKKFRSSLASAGQEKSINSYDYSILVNNIEKLYTEILINEN